MENSALERYKQLGLGLAMIAAPLTLAIGFGLHPKEPDNGEGLVSTIVDNSARWNLAHILILFGTALLIPAAIGAMRRIAGSRPGLGLVGASLVAFGAVFLGALLGADGLATSAITGVPADQRQSAAPAFQAMLDGKGALPVIFLGFLAVGGLVVLGIGLILSPAAPRWTGILSIIGGLLVGFPGVQVQAVGGLVLLAGFGYLGLELLRATSAGRSVSPAPDARAARA